MLATVDSSPLQASRWSFFTRSASPVVGDADGPSHGLVARCRSAGAVGEGRTVHTLRKRTISEVDSKDAAPRTRQRTTWLDRFYMAARVKMGLWQTELHTADASSVPQTARRSSRRSIDRSAPESSANQQAPLLISPVHSARKPSVPQSNTPVREGRHSNAPSQSDTDCETHFSLSGTDEEYTPTERAAKRARPRSLSRSTSVRRSRRLASSWDEASPRSNAGRASARLRLRPGDAITAGHVVATADGHVAPPASAAPAPEVPNAPAPSPVEPAGIILTPSYVDSAPYPPRLAPNVAKNKKRRQAGEEDISDEFFARMHRPMELIEKRSRNRELELQRYAEHLGKLRSEAPELFTGRSDN